MNNYQNIAAKIQRNFQMGKSFSLSEYCCQVPANRIGFVDNGGPFNLVQLKVIQECISLVVFAVIANFIFQHEELHWNHAAAALCLVAAVYFVFMKP
jgi:uncharacterized protein (DUF486 family)